MLRSVAKYRHLIKDEKLQQEINDFPVRKAIMPMTTIPVYLLKMVTITLQETTKFLMQPSLAVTIALEYFTAILSHQVYSTPELFIEPVHEDFKPMLLWHAAEEVEHKGVAFDAHQVLDDSVIQRNIAMGITTVAIIMLIFIRIFPLLRKDGLAFDGPTWKGGLSFMFGSQGLFTLVKDHYKEFYRSDFHPWDVQDYDMITDFRRDFDDGTFVKNNPVPG